ncbi:hypothetical protein HU200_034193 [Digitaria exilis]|uniref:KIB1-4 beta-propeller domain-containing protein n=1 Tax=Digitaria exilis TaxID=1010633 RepID=A0A835BQS1_9POAL|nr:hypothetical protein HU200_034193 [Digitaria exilis]
MPPLELIHHAALPAPACAMFAFPDGFSLPHNESFHFPDSVGYHSSCGEWVVFLCDGTYSLKNPFSKVTFTLPKLSCLCPIDEPEEIVNFPVTLEGQMPEGSLDMDAEMSMYKLVVCSSLLAAAMVNLGPLYTIALCRPVADSWLVSKLLRRYRHMDMMFYGGKLYVLDKFEDLFAIDVGDNNDNGKLSISPAEYLIHTLYVTFSFMRNGATSMHHFLIESRVRANVASDDWKQPGSNCFGSCLLKTGGALGETGIVLAKPFFFLRKLCLPNLVAAFVGVGHRRASQILVCQPLPSQGHHHGRYVQMIAVMSLKTWLSKF